MDYKYIEQLLEQYWRCETSLIEEEQLRSFFMMHKDIPAHLLKYRDLFVYQQLQQEVGLSTDFDARVLAEVEKPVVKKLGATGGVINLFVASDGKNDIALIDRKSVV